MSSVSEDLKHIYDRLHQFFGPQDWWPADTPFEVLVGAVLTQNTNWQNVAKAVDVLRSRDLLSVEALVAVTEPELAELIRSSGYYNLKAKRLKNLLAMLEEAFAGDLDALFGMGLHAAREMLLSVKGIGPETADSILLYGGNMPIFVIDTYTHRIFSRHNLVPDECDYQTMQDIFMEGLPDDPKMFNEYHALIVATAKRFCKKKNPRCDTCPLSHMLP